MIFDEDNEGPALRKKLDEFYDHQDFDVPDDQKLKQGTDNKQTALNNIGRKRRQMDEIASDNEEELEEMDNEVEDEDEVISAKP